jgi:hypothetical protein
MLAGSPTADPKVIGAETASGGCRSWVTPERQDLQEWIVKDPGLLEGALLVLAVELDVVGKRAWSRSPHVSCRREDPP